MTSSILLEGVSRRYGGVTALENATLRAEAGETVALITDGRFSGGSHGFIIGHICPEAQKGGPIALVQNGDMIEIDVPSRRIHLDVSAAELDRRAAAREAFSNPYDRGYSKLYVDTVNQADKGADLDFLVGKSGTPVMRESH